MANQVIAIAGATSALGHHLMRVLERREFPVDELRPLAGPKGAATHVQFRGRSIPVAALSPDAFSDVSLAFFVTSKATSQELIPHAIARGCLCIDASPAFRLDPRVPLVVPEINPRALLHRERGIVASPHPLVTMLTVILYPLHRAATLRRVVVNGLLAVSDLGTNAIAELRDQLTVSSRSEPVTAKCFSSQLAQNVIADEPTLESEYTAAELSLVTETRKVLEEPEISISPSCVRVPVVTGHSQTVLAEFEQPLGAKRAAEILSEAPGVRVLTEEVPTPLHTSGTDPVYVGRIRNDLASANGLSLYIVGDNLRKGGALNMVQTAELIV